MFLGLEHVAIATPNPARLAQWYVDHLGFRIILERDGKYFIRAANGSVVEFVHGAGSAPPPNPTDPGIRHLAIEVTDFNGCYASLRDRGVKFLGEPFVDQGNRLVFFTDAEGNIAHLIYRKTPLP